MYSQIYNLEPALFIEEIIHNRDVHQYHTRNSGNVHIKYYRTVKVKNSFVNKGPLYWPSLPENITAVHTITSFNRLHRSYIFANSGYL